MNVYEEKDERKANMFNPSARFETVVDLGVEVAPLGWGERAEHPPAIWSAENAKA